jgi:hypothetical protein
MHACSCPLVGLGWRRCVGVNVARTMTAVPCAPTRQPARSTRHVYIYGKTIMVMSVSTCWPMARLPGSGARQQAWS